MVEKILNNTTPYGKIRASHEGSLHSSTLMEILFEIVEFACILCNFPIRHPSSAYIRSGVRGLLGWLTMFTRFRRAIGIYIRVFKCIFSMWPVTRAPIIACLSPSHAAK